MSLRVRHDRANVPLPAAREGGREGTMSDPGRRFHSDHDPIPGERDPANLTSREPGAVGGQFTGADIPPEPHLEWLDEATAEEHAHEGGLPSHLRASEHGRPRR